MIYEVEVREVLSRVITVDADSKEHACIKAQDRWHLGQEPLGDDDFSHAEFHVRKECS